MRFLGSNRNPYPVVGLLALLAAAPPLYLAAEAGNWAASGAERVRILALGRSAETAAETVGGLVDMQMAALKSVSELRALSRPEGPGVREELQRALAVRQGWVSLALDDGQRLIATAGDVTSGLSPAAETAVSGIEQGSADRPGTVSLHYSFVRPGRGRLGLTARIRASDFWPFEGSPPGYALTITDRSGGTVFSSGPDASHPPVKTQEHAVAVTNAARGGWTVSVTDDNLKDEAGGHAGYAFAAAALSVLALCGLILVFIRRGGNLAEDEAARGRLAANTASILRKEDADLISSEHMRVLATVSHDLRQPVQGLFLTIGTLSSLSDNQMMTDLANTALQALEGLKGQLDGLLESARLYAGAIVTDTRAVPLTGILAGIDAAYARLAASRNLGWKVQAADAWVLTDPVLMGRILSNLVENALKYTETGSISVTSTVEENVMRIRVTDSGVGIPADQLQSIFSEFVQLRNKDRRQEKGLGLGLSIVQRLAAVLGVEILVGSTPGVGSTFDVIVAMADAPQIPAAGEPVMMLVHEARGRVAFVIDDTDIVRDGIASMLRSWGWAVRAFADGAAALASASETGFPDFIIADYSLDDHGGATGIDVILELRRLCGTAIPAFALTGKAFGPDFPVTGDYGIPILRKPVSGIQIQEAIRDIAFVIPDSPPVSRRRGVDFV